MNSLVIGGAGYIGSHVVLELLDQGHQVTVFDNLSTSSRKNVPEAVTFIQGDILDESTLQSVFQSANFEAVFHFAALKAAGNSMIDPGAFAKQNISGSINVLNAMVTNSVDKIIFSSSAAVYGYPKYNPIDENHPPDPINFYGFTKLEIERLLKWYSQLKGIRYAALRYFNTAGYDPKGHITELERNCANILPIVMETASGLREKVLVFGDDYDTHGGTCVRDYIHVTDLATAHIKAMNYLTETNEDLTINLGKGKGYSVFEVINLTEDITERKILFEITDRRMGDPAKLEAKSIYAVDLLGWVPEYSELENIIQTMWVMFVEKND
ncbi:MAG: UDP-glucose 4-epimerase GalE [Candidatus Marinimicrobia bacterium]|nr:UDP-glucose 4-epimerase GalE [Candidatus Neomarinimicrobiota bacterium]